MLVEDVKDPYYNGVMLLLGLATKEEDVILVNDYESLVYEFLEEVIHHCLEYDERFEQDSIHLKGHLPLVSLPNPYIVVSPLDIQHGEYFALASDMLLRMSGIRGRG